TPVFNVSLTGYDVQSINLRDIFTHPGNLPQTASAGQDPTDTISPKGPFSQDINFASCTGQLPYPTLDAISKVNGIDFIAHLQNSHTGRPSDILGGLCAGQNLGDRVARGYITVDTVNNCTLRVPSDTGYFVNGGGGDATNQNVLWGDVFSANPGQNFAEGETLVHIEAARGVGVFGKTPSDPATTISGNYTFYGRYVNWTAADNREPLSTNFAARYLNGGAFTGGTSVIAWRDSKTNQQAFTCPATPGVRPVWYPLAQEGLVEFDEQEQPVVFNATILPFPAEANKTHVNSPSL